MLPSDITFHAWIMNAATRAAFIIADDLHIDTLSELAEQCSGATVDDLLSEFDDARREGADLVRAAEDGARLRKLAKAFTALKRDELEAHILACLQACAENTESGAVLAAVDGAGVDLWSLTPVELDEAGAVLGYADASAAERACQPRRGQRFVDLAGALRDKVRADLRATEDGCWPDTSSPIEAGDVVCARPFHPSVEVLAVGLGARVGDGPRVLAVELDSEGEAAGAARWCSAWQEFGGRRVLDGGGEEKHPGGAADQGGVAL